ncbi:hypothetical protein [Halococcus hamelinensis]|jgi:hypothetical protein|uniref:hypothetical protein n=1 Tax=Halococcus hamelinensis TaxID=332168 RepID=UPI00049755BE|nr:hypothetical protein [Halococcus hamelinensis]
MSLKITQILRSGVDRTRERNGLLLVGILFVLSAVSSLLGAGVARYVPDQGFASPDAAADALFALPAVGAGVLSLVLAFASLVVSIAAIRVFVSDETERLPREAFTRRMGWVALNAIVGGVVFGIAVAAGFALLIVPGVFLLVTLAFWTVFVAVEDRNFLDGFRGSWRLTKGHRLSLLGLGVAVMLATVVVQAVFGIGMVTGPVLGGLIAAVGSAITSVFSVAVLASAYTELTAMEDDETLGFEEEQPSATSGREAI